jgi:hypothetical protein
MQVLRIQLHKPDNSDCRNSVDVLPEKLPEQRLECGDEIPLLLG